MTGVPGVRRARLLVVAVAVSVSVLVGTTAEAYWRAGGGGSGSGSTSTVSSLTLTPGTPTGTLYPGGTSDVSLVVDNPNTSPVHVGSLSRDATQGSGGIAVDGLHPGCDVAALTFTDQSNGGAGWEVPAATGGQDGSATLTLAGSLAMDSGAADACQGASFTVYLSAGP